jgi:uncharacterized protein YebE (UPF0316 family)
VVLLPILIGLAEMAVVTLDTLRTIFIARGVKLLAALLGLVEVTIWLFAISQVMQNLSNVWCFLGYAAGFTLGTYLGIRIEERLALGTQVVRIITKRDATELIIALREAGHGVTSVEASGATGKVHVLFTIVERRRLAQVADAIRQFDPQTFYVVEDVRRVARGVFGGRAGRVDWHAKRAQANSAPTPARTAEPLKAAA